MKSPEIVDSNSFEGHNEIQLEQLLPLVEDLVTVEYFNFNLYNIFAGVFERLQYCLPVDIKSTVENWMLSTSIPAEVKKSISVPIDLIGSINSDIPKVRGLIMLRDILKLEGLLVHILQSNSTTLLNASVEISDIELELLGCDCGMSIEQRITFKDLIVSILYGIYFYENLIIEKVSQMVVLTDPDNLSSERSDPQYAATKTFPIKYVELQNILSNLTTELKDTKLSANDLASNQLILGYLSDLLQCFVNDENNEYSKLNQVLIRGQDDLKRCLFDILPDQNGKYEFPMFYLTNLPLYFEVFLRHISPQNQLQTEIQKTWLEYLLEKSNIEEYSPEVKCITYLEDPIHYSELYPEALSWRLEQPIPIAKEDIKDVQDLLDLIEVEDGYQIISYEDLCKKFKIPLQSGEIEPSVLDLVKSSLSEAQEIVLELCSSKMLSFNSSEKILLQNCSTKLKRNNLSSIEKQQTYATCRSLLADFAGNDVISDAILDQLIAINTQEKEQIVVQDVKTEPFMDLRALAKEVSDIIEIGDKSIAQFYNREKFANRNREYIIKLISFLKEKADEDGVAFAYASLVSELEKAHRQGVENSGLFVAKDFYQLEGNIGSLRGYGPLTNQYIRIKVSGGGRVYVCLDANKIIIYIRDDHGVLKKT